MRRFSDLPDAISGAMVYSRKDGWYLFDRFFPEQRQLYRDNMMYDSCAAMNACLSLRLETDAARIEFSVKEAPFPPTFRGIWGLAAFYRHNDKMPRREKTPEEPYGQCFDCLVDGKRISSAPANNPVSFELRNPDGRIQQVEIIFPYMKSLMLRDVVLYRCQHVKAMEKRPFVLFLGDSLTQGANARHSDIAWYRTVAQSWDMDMLNQGICGQVFCPESLDPFAFLIDMPRRLVCAFGTNDWQCSSARKRDMRVENMRSYFATVHHIFPRVETFVVTPARRLDETVSRSFYTMAEWRDLIAQEAASYHMHVIDGTTLLPEDPAFFQDGFLHPNDRGEEYYATQFLAQAEERQGS